MRPRPTHADQRGRSPTPSWSARALGNVAKTAVLLSLLAGLLVLAGTVLAGGAGALVGLLLGAWLVAGSWMFSDRIALKAAKARALHPSEAPELHAMVADLAGRAGLPCPQLYLSPSPQPNAFATGRSPSHAVVAVSQGLIEVMPPDEVAAVVAHELGHVLDRDTLLSSVVAAMVTGLCAIVTFASFGTLVVSTADDEQSAPLRTFALLLVAPLGATVLQLALSRSREYAADQTSAELLGSTGEPIARALLRIDAHARARPMPIGPGLAQAWIVNPVAGHIGLARLFSTHPPIAERVARLRHPSEHRR
jgi:heat shock protein HtpX